MLTTFRYVHHLFINSASINQLQFSLHRDGFTRRIFTRLSGSCISNSSLAIFFRLMFNLVRKMQFLLSHFLTLPTKCITDLVNLVLFLGPRLMAIFNIQPSSKTFSSLGIKSHLVTFSQVESKSLLHIRCPSFPPLFIPCLSYCLFFPPSP